MTTARSHTRPTPTGRTPRIAKVVNAREALSDWGRGKVSDDPILAGFLLDVVDGIFAEQIWAETIERCGERVAGPNLEAFVTQIQRQRWAQGRLDAEGPIIADEKGRPVPHPALAIEKSASAEIRAWSSHFPAKRARA